VRDPLVSTTSTAKVPLAEDAQERIEVPEPPVTLVGVKVQVRPTEGDIVNVRATVPVNALAGAMVMVDIPVAPTLTWTAVGLAVTVKSVTVIVTVVEWESVPLIPSTVTVYVPTDPEHDRVEVWEVPKAILDGFRAHVKPVGETAEIKPTVPVNALIGATTIVEVMVTPLGATMMVGLAATVKSLTLMETVAKWVKEPLEPVRVTV
jgi:hypothetical protein